MSDILNLSESEARVLRAIAYYEIKSETKGVTQYACSRKVPNKFRVSDSTFSENIKNLEKKLMVLPKIEKKDSNRKTKPYTITDIGQIAWLRYYRTSKNMEIIEKIFPNIEFSAIDSIIDKIQHKDLKYIQNNYSRLILETTLDNFHIEGSILENSERVKNNVKESIEISHHKGNMKTVFIRRYAIIEPKLFEKKIEKTPDSLEHVTNFDKLEISVVDRLTFLFYYNLIRTVTDDFFAMDVIFRDAPDGTEIEIAPLDTALSNSIINKHKDIFRMIVNNKIVFKIIQNNLKELNEYKDDSFQMITKMFLKN